MKYLIAALLLIITAASTGCSQAPKEAVQEKFSLSDTMLANTKFSEAALKPVVSTLRLYGKVAADNNRQAQVYPVVGGSVIKVAVELGDHVTKGQILAVVRSGEIAEYERQRLEAGNNVAIAEKNLQVARDLNAGKLNSSRDVVIAEKEFQTAQAGLQRSNEVSRIYNIGSGATYNVTAPLSGFIIDKNVTENMQLPPDRSEHLFSIAQIDEVWILANVPESEISKIAPGMEARITTLSYPDRVFTGQVDRIFNVLDDNTKSMKVRIRIPNADMLLKPEMSASVALQQKEARQLVAIPSSAVIFDKSKNWVMVYRSRSDIETRAVEVHRRQGDVTYLLSGLEAGEQVISANQMLIYDALND